jgi:hypothetical protein
VVLNSLFVRCAKRLLQTAQPVQARSLRLARAFELPLVPFGGCPENKVDCVM